MIMHMAYELGTYRKPGKPDRIARTPSQAVQLHWDGYKHVKTENPSEQSDVEIVDLAAKLKAEAEAAKARRQDEVKAPPELTEAEMAKIPGVENAEVVDKTDEGTKSPTPSEDPKPQRPPRRP
jgi:hypothetical protein